MSVRTTVLIALVVGLAGIATWRWSSQASVVERAEQACSERNWSHAIQLLKPFLERNPGHAEARLVMARAQFARGQWHEGLDVLKQIPADSAYRAEAKFYEGSAMLEADRGESAELALRECLALDPVSIPARQQLVNLYLWEDRRSEARQLAWEIYDRARDEHRAEALGLLFRVDYGEFPLADRRIRLERFVAQNPADWHALAALAIVYDSDTDQQMRAKSLSMLNEVLEQQPGNIAARFALIQKAVEKDHEQARKLLEDWPDHPRDERYLIATGTVQQECDREFAQAAESFRRVLETQPDNWKVRGRLSVCLRMLDQPDEANRQMKRQSEVSQALHEDAIRKLLTLEATERNSADVRFQFAQLYDTVGRAKEARCWYLETLRADPSHAASGEAIERLDQTDPTDPTDQTDQTDQARSEEP